MARIAVRTEETLVNQDSFALKLYSKTDMTEAIGQSVGHTARNLSNNRCGNRIEATQHV